MICDMTHACVCHDSVWESRAAHGTYHPDVSCVWHESFIRVTRLTRVCGTTCSHVWHDKFIHSIRLVRTCYLTHVNVWRDLCGTRSRTYVWVISHTFHTCMSHITHLNHLCEHIRSLCPWLVCVSCFFPCTCIYIGHPHVKVWVCVKMQVCEDVWRCKCVSMCGDVNVWVSVMCQ